MGEMELPPEVLAEYANQDTGHLEKNDAPESSVRLEVTTVAEALANPEAAIIVESYGEVAPFIQAYFTQELSKFEQPADSTEFSAEHLPYHGIDHSSYVAESSTNLLAEVLVEFPQLATQNEPPELVAELTPEEMFQYKMAKMHAYGWGHDVVQNFTYSESSGTRARNRGAFEGDRPGGSNGNEALSAVAIHTQLLRFKNAEGKQLFAHLTLDQVLADVGNTFPDIEFKQKPNEVNRTLYAYQPHLSQDASIEGFILAQVDLRENVGNNTDVSLYEQASLAEFRELNIRYGEQIALHFSSGEDHRDMTEDEIIVFANSALSWLSVADSFVTAQLEVSNSVIDARFPETSEEPINSELNVFFKNHFKRENFEEIAAGVEQIYQVIESEYGCLDCVGSILALRTETLAALNSEDDELDSIAVESIQQKNIKTIYAEEVRRDEIIKSKLSDPAKFRTLVTRLGFKIPSVE